MPIPAGSFLLNFMNSKKTDGVSEPEVKKTLEPFGQNAMDRLATIGSLGKNAQDLTKMNGDKRFDTGELSQGAQELAQKVEQNEKTGTLQNIADRVRKFLSRPLIPDTSVIDPVTNQRINPDLLKLLNNRPDLRQRFNETGSIYSVDMP